MEMEHEIKSISDRRNWISRKIGVGGRQKSDDKNVEHVTELEQRMLLIGACAKIDAVVCGIAGITINVDHELEGIRRVRVALEEKYDEFTLVKTRTETQDDMEQFFNMLESDCKVMFKTVSMPQTGL